MADAYVSSSHAAPGAHGASGPTIRFGFGRIALYALLAVLAVLFLMPVYVMVVNSLKPLEEIRSGNLMALLRHGRSSRGSPRGARRRSACNPRA